MKTHLLTSIFIIGLFTDIFIFNYFNSDLLTYIITFLFWLTVIKEKVNSKILLQSAVVFLFFAFFLLLINQMSISERMGVWFYLFLATGMIKKLLELRETQ